VPREVCQRSTVSQSAIISQILATLGPRIVAVVSQTLSQNNRQVTQVSQVSSNRDALIRQQQLLAVKREQERRRLALLQQQSVSQSVGSSQSSSGSNLASIFGTGHEVTHSVDGQLKEQYNLGF
jgi:regulator of replication initiation timing